MSGALPTRTTVTLVTADSRITLEGATEKQAGVMTSAHVDALNRLERWIVGVDPPTSSEAQALVQSSFADTIRRLDALEQRPVPAEVVRVPVEPLAPIDLAPIVRRMEEIELAIKHPLLPVPRDDLAARVTDLEQRLSEPVDELPSFLRSAPAPAVVEAPPMQQAAIASILDRLAKVEGQVSTLSAPAAPPIKRPIERIMDAIRTYQAQAPSYLVVTAAHLARSGQTQPMAWLETLARAMGVTWEQAAIEIIRTSDAWARISIELLAIEVQARRAIEAGEDAEAVVSRSIAAIMSVGEQNAATDP